MNTPRLPLSRLRTLTVLLGTAVLAAACSTPVQLEDKNAPVETRTPTPATGAGQGAAQGAAQSQVATVDLSKNQAAAAAPERIVYFDFDSYIVKDDYKPVIEGNARQLVSNRGQRVVVEGHTDERGGREYNLALGQRRAEAVTRALMLSGVSENQVEAVSFGKERPAVAGSTEETWAKNRRAELRSR
jgi:peptidoglycan-associated lipoprotein